VRHRALLLRLDSSNQKPIATSLRHPARFGLQRRKARPSDQGTHRALAAIALAGLKTQHYNGEKQVSRCARGGTRHWRLSAKVNEHTEERSLKRLVDMEVSRKKD
jgi:hypothetical protein